MPIFSPGALLVQDFCPPVHSTAETDTRHANAGGKETTGSEERATLDRAVDTAFDECSKNSLSCKIFPGKGDFPWVREIADLGSTNSMILTFASIVKIVGW